MAGRWVGLSIIAAGPIELTSYVRVHLPYLTPYASFQWTLSPIPCFGRPMSLRNDAHEQIRGPMLEQCVAKARHESSVIVSPRPHNTVPHRPRQPSLLFSNFCIVCAKYYLTIFPDQPSTSRRCSSPVSIISPLFHARRSLYQRLLTKILCPLCY